MTVVRVRRAMGGGTPVSAAVWWSVGSAVRRGVVWVDVAPSVPTVKRGHWGGPPSISAVGWAGWGRPPSVSAAMPAVGQSLVAHNLLSKWLPVGLLPAN